MTIDWTEQWAFFSENFHSGKAHIDLKRFGGQGELLLQPGPGFGDLSHPTTYLMLAMLKKHATDHSIIDIGTGSGILSLAALLLGAKTAFGIDIDPEAIVHAQNNAALNQLPAQFSLTVPSPLPQRNVFLMNMIFPEQQSVRPDQWNSSAKVWITSGILEEQKAAYLKQAALWGWKVLEEHERQGWLGFVFQAS